MKPHKISTHSDSCCFHFFYWLSVNSFSNRIWKFHLSILKNKKVLFLEKKEIKPLSISKQKSFVYQSNFQWRFCFGLHCLSSVTLLIIVIWRFFSHCFQLVTHERDMLKKDCKKISMERDGALKHLSLTTGKIFFLLFVSYIH